MTFTKFSDVKKSIFDNLKSYFDYSIVKNRHHLKFDIFEMLMLIKRNLLNCDSSNTIFST